MRILQGSHTVVSNIKSRENPLKRALGVQKLHLVWISTYKADKYLQ
jgi:hypothetical protein